MIYRCPDIFVCPILFWRLLLSFGSSDGSHFITGILFCPISYLIDRIRVSYNCCSLACKLQAETTSHVFKWHSDTAGNDWMEKYNNESIWAHLKNVIFTFKGPIQNLLLPKNWTETWKVHPSVASSAFQKVLLGLHWFLSLVSDNTLCSPFFFFNLYPNMLKIKSIQILKSQSYSKIQMCL